MASEDEAAVMFVGVGNCTACASSLIQESEGLSLQVALILRCVTSLWNIYFMTLWDF